MPLSTVPRVFVSYARRDGQAFASELRRRLIEDHGVSPWQDLTDLEGGRDWWLEIERVLRDDNLEYLVLVMTPEALKSDIVRKEWRLARQEGKCVVPVIGSRELEFRTMSAWMHSKSFVDVEQPEQWLRFLRTLKGPCQAERVAFMAPDPPSDFVERSKEFEELVNQLLIERHEQPLAITAALQGVGGFGKTTLASALCHNERVQDAFHQGILWVTLGEEPGDLTGKVKDLILTLSGDSSDYASVETAAARLAGLLGDNALLLVIDDVWNAVHLKPFLQGGTHCARLITTRNNATLPPETRKVTVDAMAEVEAVKLLGFGLPAEEPATLRALAATLGEWPLLLKLANGVLRTRVRDAAQSLPAALNYVERSLKRYGLTAFDARDPEDRNQAVASTLGMSLDLLTDDERTRFTELAVFPEDVRIPLSTVERLWHATAEFDELDTEDLCVKFSGFSLLSELDLTTRHIRLHDVVRGYLETIQRARLGELHSRFLDGYGVELWPDLHAEEPYLWHHLSYHLAKAGRLNELRDLLFDFHWVHAKLVATDVNALLADYDHLADDEAVRRVQDALRLAVHVLAKDPTQLSSQFVGRLSAIDTPGIQNLLIQASDSTTGPWLRPVSASLVSPGGPLVRTIVQESKALSVAVTPDGRYAVSGSDAGRLGIWDLHSGVQVRTLEGHTAIVVAVLIMPDGRHALSAARDDTLRLWDLATGTERAVLEGVDVDPTRIFTFGLAVTPDGRRAIISSTGHRLEVWDLQSKRKLRDLVGHSDVVTSVVALPNGKRVLSASADQTLRIWSLRSGKCLKTLTSRTLSDHVVALFPDGKRAISSSYQSLAVWNLATGEKVFALSGHFAGVTAVAVSARGNRAVSVSHDGALKIWDLTQRSEIRTLKGFTAMVDALDLTPDGRFAITAARDHTLRLWDLEAEPAYTSTANYDYPVYRIAPLPGESRVATVTVSGGQLWDARTGCKLPGSIGSIPSETTSPILRFESHGQRVIYAFNKSRLVHIRDLATGDHISDLKGNFANLATVALSLDGRYAVTVSGTGAEVWDVATGNGVGTLKLPGITAANFTPDGRHIVTGSVHGTVTIWTFDGLRELDSLTEHQARINALAISHRGDIVVSASSDKSLRVWDLRRHELRQTLTGHTKSVFAVALFPDERRAVSGSVDHSVRVWDLDTGERIASFTGESAISTVAVVPNPLTIVVGEQQTDRVHFLRLEGGSS